MLERLLREVDSLSEKWFVMAFLPWLVFLFRQLAIWIIQGKASMARTDGAAHYFTCAENSCRKPASRPAIHLMVIIHSSSTITSSRYLSHFPYFGLKCFQGVFLTARCQSNPPSCHVSAVTGTPQASQELMPPPRPARGPTAAQSCQAIRLVNIPQINSGIIIKPHCYLIPQRPGMLLYQGCKLQRAMPVFFF